MPMTPSRGQLILNQLIAFLYVLDLGFFYIAPGGSVSHSSSSLLLKMSAVLCYCGLCKPQHIFKIVLSAHFTEGLGEDR